MCNCVKMTASEVARVPIGVALKCEHSCCKGKGVPIWLQTEEGVRIVRVAMIDALFQCVEELGNGLESVVGRLRSSSIGVDELDSELSEGTACVREIQRAIDILKNSKEVTL
jgi:hypothetical protein